MSYGTDFTADVFLNRQIFKNEYELDSEIQESNRVISSIREKIMMYASVSPSEIIPEDWKEEPIRFIHNEVTELLDWYNDEQNKLFKLELYKDTKPFKDENTDTRVD